VMSLGGPGTPRHRVDELVGRGRRIRVHGTRRTLAEGSRTGTGTCSPCPRSMAYSDPSRPRRRKRIDGRGGPAFGTAASDMEADRDRRSVLVVVAVVAVPPLVRRGSAGSEIAPNSVGSSTLPPASSAPPSRCRHARARSPPGTGRSG
jgi:hypothetical protein